VSQTGVCLACHCSSGSRLVRCDGGAQRVAASQLACLQLKLYEEEEEEVEVQLELAARQEI